MAIDPLTSVPRSRRALLAGALGGVGAWAASSIGRANLVRGANGDPVTVGGSFTGDHLTTITVTGDYALAGVSDTRPGLYGASTSSQGVLGVSDSGIAVEGVSTSFVGLYGISDSSMAVYGESAATNKPAIVGQSTGNSSGVLGFSGSSASPAAKAKTGVYGQATQDANSRGVWGTSTAGRGVYGQATSGLGVRGYATTGTGVSAEATTGYALRTTGRLRFDKSAGTATVLSGHKSVTVNPGIDLTATTAVLATLQGSAGGTTTIHRVVVDTVANVFNIYLTATATVNVKVAWLVLG